MTLQQKLDDFRTQFESGGPPMNVSRDAIETMHRATDEIRASGILDRVLKTGEKAPEFSLPDASGEIINSRDLLSNGNLVVTFYRGAW